MCLSCLFVVSFFCLSFCCVLSPRLLVSLLVDLSPPRPARFFVGFSTHRLPLAPPQALTRPPAPSSPRPPNRPSPRADRRPGLGGALRGGGAAPPRGRGRAPRGRQEDPGGDERRVTGATGAPGGGSGAPGFGGGVLFWGGVICFIPGKSILCLRFIGGGVLFWGGVICFIPGKSILCLRFIPNLFGNNLAFEGEQGCQLGLGVIYFGTHPWLPQLCEPRKTSCVWLPEINPTEVPILCLPWVTRQRPNGAVSKLLRGFHDLGARVKHQALCLEPKLHCKFDGQTLAVSQTLAPHVGCLQGSRKQWIYLRLGNTCIEKKFKPICFNSNQLNV